MFSRWMAAYAPADAAPRPRIWQAVLAALAACALWYLAHHAVAALLGTAGVALAAAVSRLRERGLARLARGRAGEDIGSFARAFDRRAPGFDPWAVRAVWEALAPWTELRNGVHLPLHPSDVIADLGCVDEDLDDVLTEAATRAKRRLDDLEMNPYYGRVVSVGDLMNFIAHQPRTAEA